MESINQDVVDTLIQATEDQYFETVVEALHALYSLLLKHGSDSVEVAQVKKIASVLSQSNEFDVRMHALALQALLCQDFEEIRTDFEANYFHPNWQVRERMVESFVHLKKSNKIEDAELRDILENQFLHTSYGFDTHFRLKEEMIQLYQMEDREHFVQEFKGVIYSEGSIEDKVTQLQTLSEIAKEKNLDLDIHEVLDIGAKEDAAPST